MIYVLSISDSKGKDDIGPDGEREAQFVFQGRRLAALWLNGHRAQGV
jgi:hypothetical protein